MSLLSLLHLALAASSRQRVILESPFAGDNESNYLYYRSAMRDSLLNHNESPIASHGIWAFSGLLDDTIEHERQLGMIAGHSWLEGAEGCVVYCDCGISAGMRQGIALAEEYGLIVTYRYLPKNPGMPGLLSTIKEGETTYKA